MDQLISEVIEVIVEWQYSPGDFFEEEIAIRHNQVRITIGGGKAEARMDPDHFHAFENIMEDMTQLLESRFLAVQALTHKGFHLSKPARCDLRQDGKKNYYLSVEPLKVIASVGTLDLIVSDKDGNVISDSRQERIDKQNWFANAVAKHRSKDTTLDHMLRSYNASVRDPANELVHLYEIRDAVASRFCREDEAKRTLDISNNEWRALGTLASRDPLEEGRHRGRHPGRLRKAQPQELALARQVASKIIEAYVKVLEGQTLGQGS